jgi:prophage regulatory protein
MSLAPEVKNTLLRLRQVQEIVPYSSSSIYHMVANGDFPAPIKLGPRASAWVESEIHSWVDSRIQMRQASEA